MSATHHDADGSYVLPPAPAIPRAVQLAAVLTGKRGLLRRLRASYGSAFKLSIPLLGDAVVLSDPAEIREMLTASDRFGNIENNLGLVLGPGSLFALDGPEHRRQRKLLVPPFNGRRLEVYRDIIEEVAAKEMASWPQGIEFPVTDSMLRITIDIILRTIFGAQGKDLHELRELLPRAVNLGGKLAMLPVPRWSLLGLGPWARFRALRAAIDRILLRLIDQARRDPDIRDRNDVLAMMVQATYDDGSLMEPQAIADQLVTLLAAGHETTATTLAWAVERLRRHPEVLARLVRESDAGGSALRQATIAEVQRVRPVIDSAARAVTVDGATLGRWTLPKGQLLIGSIALMHQDPELFPNPDRFYPERFLDAKPELHQWIPFGGGVRRCIGAAFAQQEIDLVLKLLLRDYTLEPTTRPDAAWKSRGVTWAPADGGLALVRARPRPKDFARGGDVAPGPKQQEISKRGEAPASERAGPCPARKPGF